MRHRVAHRKLNRTSSHRKSMFANMAASLLKHEQIHTTVAKAKELRPIVEKLITLGKKGTLHSRRQAMAKLSPDAKIDKLFGNTNCNFFGFDSFQGFGSISEDDKHPAFKDELFSVDTQKVLKNIKKNSGNQNYKITQGFFENTIKGKKASDLGIEKARVVMFDCDLKNPTLIALEFIKSSLQEGTIILFDDYIFYKGNKTKGEYSAFQEFKKNNSNISFRDAFEYGYGSKAFIVSSISK